MSAPGPAVVVADLRIDIAGTGDDIVDEISFAIQPGEVLGLVGESGSGKTTAALALLGHTRRGAQIAGGSVTVGDVDILKLGAGARRRIRGRVVSYVPQDPAASLNPALRVGTQLLEALQVHGYLDNDEQRRERVAEMMREVALPDDPAYLRRYPHELSGGQQQRIGLAMAFSCRPRVIVLDEPTTGLDVTTQAHVLDTVRDLARSHGGAALYVTHDLAVVASLADRVAVMYAGRIVETGPTKQLFDSAAHPYTRRLTAAIPRLAGSRHLVGIPGHAPAPGHRPKGCFFGPRCTYAVPECEQKLPDLQPVSGGQLVRCIRAEEVQTQPRTLTQGTAEAVRDFSADDSVLVLKDVCASYGDRQVVHDINLSLAPRECLALVGESGSGKTTLARTIAGLHRDRTGDILLRGQPLGNVARSRPAEVRRTIQYVFQNPYGSLNPRRTIGQIVWQPLAQFGDDGDGRRRIEETLERVSLSASYADRYPDQLSGGERQRVAIARALVCKPSVLVCDEVTSALDVSVQAAIVELLAELQRDLGLSMLFVTHNLPLVRSIAQRVAVMSEGRVVELAGVDSVLQSPSADYTRRLLSDTPSFETAGA